VGSRRALGMAAKNERPLNNSGAARQAGSGIMQGFRGREKR